MSLTNLVILNIVADMENSENLKSLPKFDRKDPEQSRQEISVWLTQKAEVTWDTRSRQQPLQEMQVRKLERSIVNQCGLYTHLLSLR